ncbi:hypothetical protein [Nannocystis punicea]|uniref:Uncharacterized protein n=1 Tax=Nannocystis punicea TaxID=2995304 RepID=A0ABY7HFW5_9BACT|nr:hypothetical protein [Nannocystis poenicansa]WAS97967.1 hypothetical protein O0S08_17645 [Nannocystis poenicansa]
MHDEAGGLAAGGGVAGRGLVGGRGGGRGVAVVTGSTVVLAVGPSVGSGGSPVVDDVGAGSSVAMPVGAVPVGSVAVAASVPVPVSVVLPESPGQAAQRLVAATRACIEVHR